MFKYEGNNSKIISVAKKCNELLDSDLFMYKIATKENGYLWSTCSGTMIADYIKSFPFDMTIELYTSKNPWTSSNGYFTPSKPHTIHLNTRKLARSNGSVCATCIHELVHAVDSWVVDDEFGHRDNKKTPEKEDTAPFYIDNIAESIVSNIPLEMIENRSNNSNIKFVPVWYKRIFMPWKWF